MLSWALKLVKLLFLSCYMLSTIYLRSWRLLLHPNCRQRVKSASHYVQIEQILTYNWHSQKQQGAKRRSERAIIDINIPVQHIWQHIRHVRLPFSRHHFLASRPSLSTFSFLLSTSRCCFSSPEVKMSTASVLFSSFYCKCSNLPSPAMSLFCLPFTTGRADPSSLSALRNYALSQFSVVRHPPWQQMCAQLWRLPPWQGSFVKFPISYCYA